MDQLFAVVWSEESGGSRSVGDLELFDDRISLEMLSAGRPVRTEIPFTEVRRARLGSADGLDRSALLIERESAPPLRIHALSDYVILGELAAAIERAASGRRQRLPVSGGANHGSPTH